MCSVAALALLNLASRLHLSGNVAQFIIQYYHTSILNRAENATTLCRCPDSTAPHCYVCALLVGRGIVEHMDTGYVQHRHEYIDIYMNEKYVITYNALTAFMRVDISITILYS